MNDKAIATAIAGGALSLALIQTLVGMNIITRDMAKSIVTTAMSQVNAYASSTERDAAHDAFSILRSIAAGFS
jgi:hypothetical protein